MTHVVISALTPVVISHPWTPDCAVTRCTPGPPAVRAPLQTGPRLGEAVLINCSAGEQLGDRVGVGSSARPATPLRLHFLLRVWVRFHFKISSHDV